MHEATLNDRDRRRGVRDRFHIDPADDSDLNTCSPIYLDLMGIDMMAKPPGQ